jgi:hypothetical protein
LSAQEEIERDRNSIVLAEGDRKLRRLNLILWVSIVAGAVGVSIYNTFLKK